MKKLILFLVLFFFASCSPMKKLDRLQKKHPYLFENIKDSIVVHDTIKVITPTTRIDTAFVRLNHYDTLFIEKDKLRAKIITKIDTIKIYAECLADTVYVPYENIIYYNQFKATDSKKNNTLKIIIVAFIFGFIFRFVWQIIKNAYL